MSGQQLPRSTAAEKDPNVLPLSTIDVQSGWFPMLPVMVSGVHKAAAAGNSNLLAQDMEKVNKIIYFAFVFLVNLEILTKIFQNQFRV